MALSPAARTAFQDLNAAVLGRRSLSHLLDRQKALSIFMELMNRGEEEELDPADVERWFLDDGWDECWASILAEMPGDIAFVRTNRTPLNPERVNEWFSAT